MGTCSYAAYKKGIGDMPQQAAFEDNRAYDFAQKQVKGLPFTMLAVLPNG